MSVHRVMFIKKKILQLSNPKNVATLEYLDLCCSLFLGNPQTYHSWNTNAVTTNNDQVFCIIEDPTGADGSFLIGTGDHVISQLTTESNTELVLLGTYGSQGYIFIHT